MSRSFISILLFIVFQVVGFFAAALVLTDSVADAFSSEQTASVTVWGTIIESFLMFFTLWGLRFFKPSDLTKKVPWEALVLSVTMTLLLIEPIGYLNSAFELENNLEELFEQISHSFWGVLSVAVLGPVIEETVFRRIVIEDCLKRFGKRWTAIIVSSLLFGLLHMNPAQMFSAFLMGLALGWTYCRTQSMLPGVIVHIVNNSIGILEMRFSEDGWSLLPEGVKFYQNPWTLLLFAGCIALAFGLASVLNRFYDRNSLLQGDGGAVEGVE